MAGNHSGRGFGDARALLRDLRALDGAVAPPRTLLAAVLRDLGLGDAYFSVELPIGRVFIAHNARGVSAVQLAATAQDFERDFAARCGRSVCPEAAPPADLGDAVRQALSGTSGISGTSPSSIPFDLDGLTEFERAVLLKALEIPRGEVRPYGWIAREIGRPKAVRAVGSALGHNPVPLLIPCHRVVRSDGQLGQYSMGGEAVKRAVLTLEGADVAALERFAASRTRCIGNDVSGAYCLPSCRHVRSVSPAHWTAFHSCEAAEAAGYHPCTVCRPC